jgi:hypothetical protein
MVLFAGHLAHVFLTRHGRGYLRAMIRGSLPEEITRERHALWWARVKAEESPAPGTDDETP